MRFAANAANHCNDDGLAIASGFATFSTGVPSSSSVIPITPLSGVRISWDMLATKRDLALWAAMLDSRHAIKVIWNESRLRQDLSPNAFQQAVHEFRHALAARLGDQLVWHIESAQDASDHRIEVTPRMTGTTPGSVNA